MVTRARTSDIFKRANTFEYNPKRPKGLNDVNGVATVNRYTGPNIKTETW